MGRDGDVFPEVAPVSLPLGYTSVSLFSVSMNCFLHWRWLTQWGSQAGRVPSGRADEGACSELQAGELCQPPVLGFRLRPHFPLLLLPIWQALLDGPESLMDGASLQPSSNYAVGLFSFISLRSRSEAQVL